MRAFALVLAGVALFGVTAADDAKEDAVRKELEALKGSWTVVSADRDGKKFTDEQLKDLRLVYAGDRATVKNGDKVLFVGTVKLDPGKKPKTIDATQTSDGENKGKTFLGIYEVDGDTLKCARPSPPGRTGPRSSPPSRAAAISSGFINERRSKVFRVSPRLVITSSAWRRPFGPHRRSRRYCRSRPCR